MRHLYTFILIAAFLFLVDIAQAAQPHGYNTRQPTTQQAQSNAQPTAPDGYNFKPATGTPLEADAFVDTVWLEVIDNGDPPQTYVHLRADGSFGYNYDEPHSFTYDGTDTWSVQNGQLLLSWTDGYCIDTFPLDKLSGGRVEGIQSVGNKRIVFTKER